MKKLITLCLLLATAGVSQSPVNLDVTITPYVTYYISSIDLNTGSSSIPIFQATLSNNTSDSVRAMIEFEITVSSEALELDNETILRLRTEPFYFSNDIFISNMDMTVNTHDIYDVEGTQIDFRVNIEEQIDLDRATNLFNNVVSSGQLPDGNYTFGVKIFNGDDEFEVWQNYNETINVTSPVTLTLSDPGGDLADISENGNVIATPTFNWDTDPCQIPGGCAYYIRVAEYDPCIHGSADEAIESTTRLPLNQSEEWYYVGNGVTSFTYPTGDAGPLEDSKVYVWQMLKVMSTTAGYNGILSNINAFRVGSSPNCTQAAESNTNMQVLKSLIGDDMYNNIFAECNSGYCYLSTGNVLLDESPTDFTFIQSLISQGVAETDSTGTVTYHPINILSVEVSE